MSDINHVETYAIVKVCLYNGGDAETVAQNLRGARIVPAGHVRAERDDLGFLSHGTPVLPVPEALAHGDYEDGEHWKKTAESLVILVEEISEHRRVVTNREEAKRVIVENAKADVASGILRSLDYQDNPAYRAAYLAALEALEADAEPF